MSSVRRLSQISATRTPPRAVQRASRVAIADTAGALTPSASLLADTIADGDESFDCLLSGIVLRIYAAKLQHAVMQYRMSKMTLFSIRLDDIESTPFRNVFAQYRICALLMKTIRIRRAAVEVLRVTLKAIPWFKRLRLKMRLYKKRMAVAKNLLLSTALARRYSIARWMAVVNNFERKKLIAKGDAGKAHSHDGYVVTASRLYEVRDVGQQLGSATDPNDEGRMKPKYAVHAAEIDWDYSFKAKASRTESLQRVDALKKKRDRGATGGQGGSDPIAGCLAQWLNLYDEQESADTASLDHVPYGVTSRPVGAWTVASASPSRDTDCGQTAQTTNDSSLGRFRWLEDEELMYQFKRRAIMDALRRHREDLYQRYVAHRAAIANYKEECKQINLQLTARKQVVGGAYLLKKAVRPSELIRFPDPPSPWIGEYQLFPAKAELQAIINDATEQQRQFFSKQLISVGLSSRIGVEAAKELTALSAAEEDAIARAQWTSWIQDSHTEEYNFALQSCRLAPHRWGNPLKHRRCLQVAVDPLKAVMQTGSGIGAGIVSSVVSAARTSVKQTQSPQSTSTASLFALMGRDSASPTVVRRSEVSTGGSACALASRLGSIFQQAAGAFPGAARYGRIGLPDGYEMRQFEKYSAEHSASAPDALYRRPLMHTKFPASRMAPTSPVRKRNKRKASAGQSRSPGGRQQSPKKLK